MPWSDRIDRRRHLFVERVTPSRPSLDVLRAGVVEPAEFEHGSWRHRVKTNRICVVVVLVSEREAVVVTTWRIR